jgi:Domain of unknown function (DUF6473)
MAYAFPGAGALDYSPCSYAASRLTFRGPRADLKEPFISCIGGTETYGKFIPTLWRKCWMCRWSISAA